MSLTRPQVYALMVLAYVGGVVFLLLEASAEEGAAFALAMGLILGGYGYVWFVRDRRT